MEIHRSCWYGVNKKNLQRTAVSLKILASINRKPEKYGRVIDGTAYCQNLKRVTDVTTAATDGAERDFSEIADELAEDERRKEEIVEGEEGEEDEDRGAKILEQTFFTSDSSSTYEAGNGKRCKFERKLNYRSSGGCCSNVNCDANDEKLALPSPAMLNQMLSEIKSKFFSIFFFTAGQSCFCCLFLFRFFSYF